MNELQWNRVIHLVLFAVVFFAAHKLFHDYLIAAGICAGLLILK